MKDVDDIYPLCWVRGVCRVYFCLERVGFSWIGTDWAGEAGGGIRTWKLGFVAGMGHPFPWESRLGLSSEKVGEWGAFPPGKAKGVVPASSEGVKSGVGLWRSRETCFHLLVQAGPLIQPWHSPIQP